MPSALDPQSWNRYAYTLNNPVRYTDPTGHMVKDEDGGGGGGGGGDGGGGDGGGEPIVVTPETANQYYNPPVDTGEPQYPNGKACWPRCNRDDAIETERNQDPIQVAIGSGSGAFCFSCRYRGNVHNEMGPIIEPDGSGGGGAGAAGGAGAGLAAARWVAANVNAAMTMRERWLSRQGEPGFKSISGQVMPSAMRWPDTIERRDM